MPEKEKFRNILNRYLLLLCFLTAVCGLTIFSIVSYSLHKNVCFMNLADIRDQQLKLIESWFKERDEEISQLSQSVAAKDNDLPQMKKLFQEQLGWSSTCFNTLAFADTQGKVLLVEGEQEYHEVNVADQEYYRLALEGKSNISETQISKFSGKFTIAVSSPVFSEEGEIAGLIIGSLNIEKLEQMLSSLDLGKTGSTYLLDKKGIIVTVPYYTLWPVESGTVDKTGKYRYQLKDGAVRGLEHGKSGYGEYDNYQASRVFGAYKAMDNYSWSLAVEVDKAEIMQPFREKMSLAFLLFVVAFFLFVFPLLKIVTRRVAQPLEHTAERVAQYAGDGQEEGSYKWTEEKNSTEEITELNQAFQKMSEKTNELMDMMRVQALYDPLTGLANRRQFFARGQEIIELVRRKAGYCSLIYFDIDGFKKINDLYGNNIGDQVLIHIAEVLGRIARISDVAGRLAGEEFAVLLPETDEKGAWQFALRFKKYVEEIPVEVDYRSFHITISIGVATFKSEGRQKENSSQLLEALINQSEEAMVKAKGNGGNRIESCSV